MELLRVRSLAREIIAGKANAEAVEAALGRFTVSAVRGDAVPTIADGYAALLEAINAQPVPTATGAVQREFAFPPPLKPGPVKIRIRAEVFNEATGEWEVA